MDGQASSKLLLALFFVLTVLTVSAQEASAAIIFQDPFNDDPASIGWAETITQIPTTDPPISNPDATGNISPNTVGQVVLEKTDGIGTLDLYITRTIPTTGFENIALELTAYQSSPAYQDPDFIRIEFDTGNGFEILLEDHNKWFGVNDPTGEGGNKPGNINPKSTGPLGLPPGAKDNPNLQVRLTVRIDAVNADIFFDNFVLSGDTIVIGSDSDIDGIIDELDNCPKDPNATQDDIDGDNIGDVCDLDYNFVKKLIDDNQALRDENADLLKQLTYCQNENKKLGDDKQALTEKINSLQNALDQCLNENTTFENDNKDLSIQMVFLESLIADLNNQIQSLLDRISELEFSNKFKTVDFSEKFGGKFDENSFKTKGMFVIGGQKFNHVTGEGEYTLTELDGSECNSIQVKNGSLDFGNGNTINYNMDGEICKKRIFSTLEGTLTVTGGTGDFEDSQGSAQVVQQIFGKTFVGTLEGTITILG